MTAPGSLIKSLAKLHGLPPFVKLFQNDRTAIVIVHRKYAEQWRSSLGSSPFTPDTEGDTTTWESVAHLDGMRVRLIYGTHQREEVPA